MEDLEKYMIPSRQLQEISGEKEYGCMVSPCVFEIFVLTFSLLVSCGLRRLRDEG